MRRLHPALFDTHVNPHLEAVNLVLDDNNTQMLDVSRIIEESVFNMHLIMTHYVSKLFIFILDPNRV